MSAQHVMPRRWYQEPLVWMLIAIPGSAVVMGAVMLTLATSTYDGLVADDYYKRGLQINRSIAREKHAASHGIAAKVHIENGAVALFLEGELAEVPDTLILRFLHATRQGLDDAIKVKHTGQQQYQATLGEILIEANTLVRVETSTWRIGQRLERAVGKEATFALVAEQAAW
jgi:uncharacterized protein